ncbi:PAS domain-containing sensor histidine kinase [Ideonella sp.]|uniref:sensor histidine kinase n=1 Tax=Ideonella sp. TaxID=1929293 RepID=UPI003BB6E34B
MSPLPVAPEAAWREAQAALLDHLQRHDAQHALQRLARSLAHVMGVPCGLFAAPADVQPGDILHHWVGGAGADPVALRTADWQLPLMSAGHAVGWLGVQGIALQQRAERAAQIAPMLDVAAALIAAWLEQRGLAPPASLTLARSAMREAGTFVWEWDIRSDVLGDIDEGALMLGYGPNDIGHTQDDWTALIHPEDQERVEEAYQRHARGEAPLYQVVYRARDARGEWRWLEERGRVVERDDLGRPLKMYGTQTDASLQHELEQAVRDRWAAEAANAAKTRFLSSVSHELRTPLNAVLGFAQLLETDTRQPLPPTQLRHVGLIRQAGAHLLAMITDLLDVSMIEAGQLAVASTSVPLEPLLVEALALVQSQAAQASVRVMLQPVPARASVRADPLRLRQVLVNLLSNGIKYNRAGGWVQVSVLPVGAGTDAGWQLEVQDNGLGISPEQMPHLFEPFNRLGREHGGVPGAGLGLALSRMLVLAMGGQLSARSAEQGTVFVARLAAA